MVEFVFVHICKEVDSSGQQEAVALCCAGRLEKGLLVPRRGASEHEYRLDKERFLLHILLMSLMLRLLAAAIVMEHRAHDGPFPLL